VALANPLSEAYAVLRRSLVPDLVETARFNQRRGLSAVRLFEIGSVFHRGTPDPTDEPEHVALVCGGTAGNAWERETELDFFDLKGAVEGLAESLGVEFQARPAELPGLLAGNTAELLRDGKVVGYLGRVEEEEAYPIYAGEIALDALTGGGQGLAVELPSRFPGIAADLTFTHALSVAWSQIRSAVEALRPPDLVSWELVARYQGPGVPAGAVNTTVRFLYNAGDRSLTQEEVNERQAALAGRLEERFGWRG
jgi:phenylalanyl-tRNA synthetase beta chain